MKLTGHCKGLWGCDLRLRKLTLGLHETVPVVTIVEFDRGLITLLQQLLFVPGPFKSLALLFFNLLDLVFSQALIIRDGSLFALFLGRRRHA